MLGQKQVAMEGSGEQETKQDEERQGREKDSNGVGNRVVHLLRISGGSQSEYGDRVRIRPPRYAEFPHRFLEQTWPAYLFFFFFHHRAARGN